MSRHIWTVLFLLAACGGPEALLQPQPEAISSARVSQVLVATTRAPTTEQGMLFDGKRSETTTYMDFDISIPPDREVGAVKYPSPVPDPQTEFISLGQDIIASDRQFLAEVNANLHKRPPGKRTLLIFTHGYNTSFPESVFRMAQIEEDFGFKGVGVLYSWPSAASVPLYAYDRDSQLFAREGFAKLLTLLARSDANEILILGHSMGGLLTMETLRTLSLSGQTQVLNRISGLVLASPDIDVDVFRKQIAYVDPSELPVIVLGATHDRALLVSSIATGGHPRVGGVESIDELRSLGVVVIDTTGVDDAGASGHSDFATSPTLLAMVQDGSLRDAVVNGRPSNGLLVGAGSLLSNAAATLVYLPVLATGQ